MLAKQIWRLHTNPDSLITRCYKAKYFPFIDVLQAPIGANPSYTWRSLHSSIPIILQGSCWRIGNGEKVNIWRDNWLPLQNKFKLLTPAPPQPTISHVKDLLDRDNLTWNKATLDNNFYLIDKLQIEQLPLVNIHKDDELMWMYESNGHYMVKSGYRAIQSWKSHNPDQPTTSDDSTKI